MSDYCRNDVLRIFGIREAQLRIWERNGLLACASKYSFQDLGQVRKLRECSQRMTATGIRNAVVAMRAVSGLSDPLLEAGLALGRPGVSCKVGQGPRRLLFRHSGTVVEPIAGQYLLDFTGTGKRSLAAIACVAVSAGEREQHVARLFSDAVRAEEAGKLAEASEGYAEVLAMQPGHAPSAINLGTICYNRREFLKAEQFYRLATESDARYALAFFDLGNVLDELKRMPEAIEAYRRAIQLQPGYADAHYNLALALERSGARRQALQHWTAYLKLDSSGPWARHARTQLRKTLALTGFAMIQGQGRGVQREPVAYQAALLLRVV